MTSAPLDLVLVSTPIGALGSGRGGVELTLTSLLRGLAQRGHRLRLVAAEVPVFLRVVSRCSCSPLPVVISPVGSTLRLIRG